MAWQDFLSTQGAQFDAELAVSFPGEQQPAEQQQGAALVPLSHFGLIRFSGEETAAFLHGQLSSDVKQLGPNRAQYSTYSTPKGRMLASLLVLADGEDRLLMLPRALLPTIQKRLSMYVLRSKTKASDISADTVLLGLCGAQAAGVAKQLGGSLPTEALQKVDLPAGWLLKLDEGRFLLGIAAAQAETIWQVLLAAGASPAGAAAWTLADIRAGITWVLPATQEAFVPQMANMELIGAVNFKKGCYPGQEIVARTQYLGKLKRRALRVQASSPMQAGESVFSPEMQDQASGQVALAAPSADGLWEALVVVQLSSIEHGLHVQGPQGPALSVLPLPYTVIE